MKAAVRHLVEEHHAVQALLDDLEKALDPLDLEGMARQVEDLDDLLARHRRKEEAVLFPALVRLSAMKEEPLATAAREHDLEEVYVEETKAFLAVARENTAFAGPLVEACRALILFYRDHLWKEENFVFPWADRVLTETEQEDLVHRMSLTEVSV